jgi:AcrR family transcriptional regulator
MNGGSFMQYLKDDIKYRIQESALAEFRAMGYNDASMRKIAKNAHVAIGNVYHYYENKQELFNALVGSVYETLMFSLGEINQIDAKEAVEYKFIKGTDDGNYYGINLMVGKLLEICKEHNTELLILMEKSKGVHNRYENTKQDLINLLDEVLREKMLPNFTENGLVVENIYITFILSTAFIEGFCSILRKYENGAEVKTLVDQMIKIFFKDIDSRF